MTGGISESFYIKSFLEYDSDFTLWGFLRRAYELKSLIGASIDGSSDEQETELENGLVEGHAVSHSV